MEDTAEVQRFPPRLAWALCGCGQQECCLSRSWQPPMAPVLLVSS